MPGNKAIVVTENTYRIHADVVACFEHRRYDVSGNYVSGVEFTASDGKQVINFPIQHIESGIKKNNDSGHQYKRVARILKTINVELDGKDGYKKLPSFFIECLAWNVPNNILTGYSTYYDSVRASIQFLSSQLIKSDSDDWTEVSGYLWLFKNHTKWTKQDGLNFLGKAWEYAEFSKNG